MSLDATFTLCLGFFLQRHFGHKDISVIFLLVLLQLDITVLTAGTKFARKLWGTKFVWYACRCAYHTNIVSLCFDDVTMFNQPWCTLFV